MPGIPGEDSAVREPVPNCPRPSAGFEVGVGEAPRAETGIQERGIPEVVFAPGALVDEVHLHSLHWDIAVEA